MGAAVFTVKKKKKISKSTFIDMSIFFWGGGLFQINHIQNMS